VALEGDADEQGEFSGRDAFAAEEVHGFDAVELGDRKRADDASDLIEGGTVGQHEREIAFDGGETRQRRETALRAMLGARGAQLARPLVMEAAQSYLPARVENNLDVLCNLAGAAAGAALGLGFAPRLREGGPLQRARANLFAPGADTDLGLVLIGLWLFTQLNPAMLLFGAGDLRDLLVPPGGQPRAPTFFASIEAITAAANLAAVGLLVSCLAAPGQPVRRTFLALLLAALAIKTAAFAILMRAENVLAWLTPGAQQGLVVGLAAALAAVSLPRVVRLAAAAMLLMAATVLVNLAPPNPYLAATLKVWQQGHFLNFNGLTRLVSVVWPLAALGYLILLAARRREPVG